jgi:hypothetical protein
VLPLLLYRDAGKEMFGGRKENFQKFQAAEEKGNSQKWVCPILGLEVQYVHVKANCPRSLWHVSLWRCSQEERSDSALVWQIADNAYKPK